MAIRRYIQHQTSIFCYKLGKWDKYLEEQIDNTANEPSSHINKVRQDLSVNVQDAGLKKGPHLLLENSLNFIYQCHWSFLGDLAFELGGSFLLCFVGYGYYSWLVLQPERIWYMDALIPVAFALCVALIIHLMRRFQRTAYLSLSITLLFFVGCELSLARTGLRILFQFLGYLGAAGILMNLFGTVCFYQSGLNNIFSYAVEILASWCLSMVVVLVGKRSPSQSKTIVAITIPIVLLGWTVGAYSGAIMNHGLYCARLLLDQSEPQILYLVSPLLGAALAYASLTLWFRCGTYRAYCQQRGSI